MVKSTRRYIGATLNETKKVNTEPLHVIIRVNLNRSRSQFVEFVLTYDNATGNVIRISTSVENEYNFAIILWIWM